MRLSIAKGIYSLFLLTNVKAKFCNDMSPGMGLRLEDKTIKSFKNAMQEFLPHYINVDMNLPKEWSYTFNLLGGALPYTFTFTNIQYETGQFDFKDIDVELRERGLKFDFPSIEKWTIHSHLKVDSWIDLPDGNDMTIFFNNFDLILDSYFSTNDKGFIRPYVHRAEVNFGKSYIYHDNQFIAFFMTQFIELGLMVL